MNPTQPGIAPPQTDASQVQTGMYPQSQMDRTQFSTPTQMPVSKEVISSDYDSTISPYTGDMPRFAGGGLDQYQYAKGGEVGIKSAAKELAQYGRMGDTIVAHINPQEAHMLKQMGGSGTINPHTGLPEFGMFGIGGGGGILGTGINKGANDPVSNVLSNNPISKGISSGVQGAAGAVDKGLVSLDKSIGKVIPGGWGTLAATAASFIPIIGPALAVGIGALNGSGVMHKGGHFNLQGAVMGGAMAYGMSNLATGFEAAGGGVPTTPTPDLTSAASQTATSGTGDVFSGLSGTSPSAPVSEISPNLMNAAQSNIDPIALEDMSSQQVANANVLNTPQPATSFTQNIKNLASGTADNLSATGRGLTNLSGLGPDGLSGASTALDAAKSTPMSYTNTALPIAAGTMGLMSSDAQRAYDTQVNDQNSAANAQYNAQMAAIQDSQDRANRNMRAHPYQFAGGGAIAFGNGGDVPRFLSGGGDGLSDSIDATIDNNQPAKLADGEFVVSSDVVSGLGGGSSKAGAKKLYAMMDRVRKQAHGTKKQIRPVSTKALPA